MTAKRVATSYALAVGSACPLAFGLGMVRSSLVRPHCGDVGLAAKFNKKPTWGV